MVTTAYTAKRYKRGNGGVYFSASPLHGKLCYEPRLSIFPRYRSIESSIVAPDAPTVYMRMKEDTVSATSMSLVKSIIFFLLFLKNLLYHPVLSIAISDLFEL